MNAGLWADTLSRSCAAGTPLLLGTLGEICAERAGVLNLGVEGMMAVGAVAGFGTAAATGSPWLGLAAAAAAGAALSVVHAVVTVALKANQIVSGIALTMLGLGLSGVWGRSYVGTPLAARFGACQLPLLGDIPLLGPAFFRQDPVFYLALLLTAAISFLLWRTRWGITVRSVGENPLAADAAGVDVARVRFLCVAAGGTLAGLAGGYLSLVYIPSWIEGMTAGRGWIVIALTIFAGWDPRRAVLGALLFGGIDAAQYLFQAWVPPNFLKMLPYLATILALLAGRRTAHGEHSAPVALGLPYRKGER
ncbi:MAG: ABC transporter permease [Elusimicrobia bacterium]|nr:ABC transporter permease [Elusimicrobiota bacterium]